MMLVLGWGLGRAERPSGARLGVSQKAERSEAERFGEGFRGDGFGSGLVLVLGWGLSRAERSEAERFGRDLGGMGLGVGVGFGPSGAKRSVA